MASYLEAYGAAEESRARLIRLAKIGSIILAGVVAIGLTLYAVLKNRSEEQQAKLFLHLLEDHNYSAAYKLWGCTDATPCPQYPMGKFMEDWGPQSPHGDQSSVEIGLSQTCGSGVVIRLDYKGAAPVPLWVERASEIVSFAPWPECPGRHMHIGAWLRSIFKH